MTVAFGRTGDDAKRTDAAYRVFAEGTGSPVDDILSHRGNAVLVWDNSPTDGERSELEGRLR